MPTRSTTLTAVRTLLQIPNTDQLIFDTDITDILIENAILEFSRVKSRRIFQAYYGNSEFNRELPDSWVDQFSNIIEIKTHGGQARVPVDANSYVVVQIDNEEYTIASALSGATSITLSTVANARYFKKGDVITLETTVDGTEYTETNWASADGNATTGVITLKNATSRAYSTTPNVSLRNHIRFLQSSPIATERFIVEYTGIHTHDDDTNTILSSDYSAFCNLIAGHTAYAISAKFAQHTDSSFDADTVDYAGLSQQWADVGNRYLELFNKHYGIGAAGATQAAIRAGGANVDLNLGPRYPGKFLFNNDRLR